MGKSPLIKPEELDALWAGHNAAWRDPAQIVSQWGAAAEVDPRLLRFVTSGAWWEILSDLKLTLLVTREYEHLVMAVRVTQGKPVLSYLPLPHPSGLAVDLTRTIVYVASTRNPNQVFDLTPVTGQLPRLDAERSSQDNRPLIPIRSRFFPGCFYIHDLALVGGELYANSVGQNAVVRLYDDSRYDYVWWPRCIEKDGVPAFGQNYIQLNSIAAGADLSGSYYSASADKLSARRPGHKNFPVSKRGVIFSGATREPVAHGLTRPHSARLYEGCVWVDNSGYGEVGVIGDGRFNPVTCLPGWTRGLYFHKNVAFVGTSRVLPRFTQYAPGLDLSSSVCGMHAVDTNSGRVLGSLIWPYGNQIFAIEGLPDQSTGGLPFVVSRKLSGHIKKLFYHFQTQ